MSTARLALTLLLAGCGPRPAAVELLAPLPSIVLGGRPTPLPRAVVEDAAGQPIPGAPTPRFSAQPSEILAIEDGELVAKADGQAELVAELPEHRLRASVWVKVRMIQRIELGCTPSCTVEVGQALEVHATAYGVDEAFKDFCAPKLLGAGFEERGPGVFVSARPAKATVACGGVEQAIRASPKIDALRLECPRAAGVDGDACRVELGRRLRPIVRATGGGVEAAAPTLSWRSTKPGIADVAADEVLAVGLGEAEVTASVGGVSATLRIEVVRPSSLECSGKARRFLYTYLPQQRTRGRKLAGAFTVECELALSEECLLANLEGGPAQVEQALDRCCCQLSRARLGPPQTTPRPKRSRPEGPY